MAEPKPEFFGHPRGLIFVGGTELWERISFHGMQALLTLYMAEQLLLPGHIENVAGLAGLRAAIESVTGPLSTRALATQIFGLYIGFVYFTPMLGGWVGDRVLGRRRTVALGALLMTAGHFCMAFDRSFVIALVLLCLGAGALRGNLPSQLGDLYSKDDRRRAAAFQIYYFLLAMGAFIAPLITGWLAQSHGWHFGFGFAGVGMLIGLFIYWSGGKHLPADAPRRVSGTRARLTADERRIVLVLVGMLIPLSTFWVAQSQVWNAYNLWVRDHLDLMVLGWRMPVAWLQAFDSLAPMAAVPIMLYVWRIQAARGSEPRDLTKLAIGCLLFTVALVWLAGASVVTDSAGQVPLLWALAFHVILNFGFVFFAPTAVALYARSAPPSVNALMVGVYSLSVFIGGTVSGRLGGFYERMSATKFWLMHAAIVVIGGVFFLFCSGWLRAALTPRPTTVQERAG